MSVTDTLLVMTETADWGFLPNPRLPHTFIAMAYDQPDPRNGTHGYWNTTSKQVDKKVPYPGSCIEGKEICPLPGGLMGGNIHPRKFTILTAANLAIGQRILIF